MGEWVGREVGGWVGGWVRAGAKTLLCLCVHGSGVQSMKNAPLAATRGFVARSLYFCCRATFPLAVISVDSKCIPSSWGCLFVSFGLSPRRWTA